MLVLLVDICVEVGVGRVNPPHDRLVDVVADPVDRNTPVLPQRVLVLDMRSCADPKARIPHALKRLATTVAAYSVGPRRPLLAVRTLPGLAAAQGLDLVLDASVGEVGATTLGSTALESSEEATESLAEAGFIGEGEGHSELLSERPLHVERMLPHLGVVVE